MPLSPPLLSQAQSLAVLRLSDAHAPRGAPAELPRLLAAAQDTTGQATGQARRAHAVIVAGTASQMELDIYADDQHMDF